ncbi:hypothetical protein BJ742DRAFT_503412 [Cladochytrium replicatum]|nr:hypothetical protein BJ742DRAFT_503412 [Cladochytrium replicatum]
MAWGWIIAKITTRCSNTDLRVWGCLIRKKNFRLVLRREWDENCYLLFLISISDDYHATILAHYMDLMDFAGDTLDTGFRRMCAHLYLTGETQAIDRILYQFSRRYWECNPHSQPIFRSIDTVYGILFSIMLLNTDLHIANVATPSRRMQQKVFVRNTMELIKKMLAEEARNAAANAGSAGSGADSETSLGPMNDWEMRRWRTDAELMLKELYQSIKDNPIQQRSATVDGEEYRAGVSSDAYSTVRVPGGGSPHSNGIKSVFTFGSNTGSSLGSTLRREDSIGSVYSVAGGESPGYAGSKAPSITGRKSPFAGLSFGRKSGSNGGKVMGSGSSMILGKSVSSVNLVDASEYNSSPTSMVSSASSVLAGHTGSVAIQRRHSSSSGSSSGPAVTGVQGSWSPLGPQGSGLPPRGGAFSPPQHGGGGSGISMSVSASFWNIGASSGAVVALEGLLVRKHLMEKDDQKARNRKWVKLWCALTVDSERGVELNLFRVDQTVDSSAIGNGSAGGGEQLPLGNGSTDTFDAVEVKEYGTLANVQNAKRMLRLTNQPPEVYNLLHSFCNVLPTGYSQTRTNVLSLHLCNGSTDLFHAPSTTTLRAWHQAINTWAARKSKEPIRGAMSSYDYGWNYIIAEKRRRENEEKGRKERERKSEGDGGGGSGRASNATTSPGEVSIYGSSVVVADEVFGSSSMSGGSYIDGGGLLYQASDSPGGSGGGGLKIERRLHQQTSRDSMRSEVVSVHTVSTTSESRLSVDSTTSSLGVAVGVGVKGGGKNTSPAVTLDRKGFGVGGFGSSVSTTASSSPPAGGLSPAELKKMKVAEWTPPGGYGMIVSHYTEVEQLASMRRATAGVLEDLNEHSTYRDPMERMVSRCVSAHAKRHSV